MSLRHAVRRGITVAMHTDVAILHAAAVTEFLGHVQRSNNQREEAMELWQSVVEVVHFPHHQAMCWKPLASDQCYRSDVPIQNVADASRNGVGFRFPWLGVWTRCGTLVRTGLFERTHGVITAKAKGRWTCSWSRPMLRGIVPPQWRQVMAALGPGDVPGSASKADAISVFQCGAIGKWGTSVGWTPLSHCPPGVRPLVVPSTRHRGLAYWFDGLVEGTPYMLAPPCLRCGTPSRRVCAGCFKPQCYECYWAGDQRDCCDERPRGGRCHQCSTCGSCGPRQGLEKPPSHAS